MNSVNPQNPTVPGTPGTSPGASETSPEPAVQTNTGVLPNPFGKADMLRACEIEFDESTRTRARDYADAGHVQQMHFNGVKTLTATVKGSEDNQYQLKIDVTRGRENLSLRGICNCPVRLNCAHVGAALYAWVDSEEAPVASADSVAIWRNALNNQKEQEDQQLSVDSVVVLYRIRQTRMKQGCTVFCCCLFGS